MTSILTGLHFQRPGFFLWMLVALALTSLFWYGKYKLDLAARKRYGDERLVNRSSEMIWLAGQITVLTSWLVAVALLFTAIAGPVSPDAPTKVQQGSLQVVILADVSKSMAAEDYRAFMPPKDGVPAEAVPGPYGTRLDMAKLVIQEQIMPAIIGNQMGIATYMGNGFDLADLTDDFSYLRDSIKMLMKIGNAPGGGSDYSDGLLETLTIFNQTPDPDKQKVVVWFTDGGYTGEQKALDEAIDKIQQAHVRVIIIGVGSDSPIPIPVYDDNGQQTGNIEKDGKVVSTQIDEAALEQLQTKIGAEYIRMIPGKALGIQWASKLAGGKTEQHESDMYMYPLGACMAIMLVLFLRGLFSASRRKKTS